MLEGSQTVQGLSGRSGLKLSWAKERLSVRPGVGKCSTYQSFKESLSSCGTTRNHIPHPLFQLRQSQLFRDFGRCHCTGYILFVCKYQKQCLLHLSIEDDAM